MEEIKKIGSWKSLLTLNNAPFFVLVIMCALLPLFFIPSPFVTFAFSKIILVSVGVTLALMLFLVNLLKNGNLAIPRHPIFLSLVLVVVVHLISALFSSTRVMSISGYGFETTTFTTILILCVVAFLVSIVFQSQKRIFAVHSSLLIVSGILSLFYISRLMFGANFLSFGQFSELAANTIGRWNELAIFFGVSAILSLMSLTMLKMRSVYRICLALLFLLSLAMLVIVNLSLVWYAIVAISIILFVYFLSSDSAKLGTISVSQVGVASAETKMKPVGRTVSFVSLILLVLALVFAFTPVGPYFAGKVNEKFNINNLDVRPSWTATYEIAEQSLKANPILGAGPNRFNTQWQMYRPDVNSTNFWSVDFYSGIGWIPTIIIETGILGAITWLAFLGCFLFFGFASLFRKAGDRVLQYLTASSFVVSLFLWIIAVIYVPTMTMLALTFFFTGLSIATMYLSGASSTRVLNIFKYRKMNFLVATVLVLLFVVSAGFGYVFLEKAVAYSYFQRGASLAIARENLDTSATYLLRAENLAPLDLYYRSLAELSIFKLNAIITESIDKETISEETKLEFQSILGNAIEASRRAQMWDRENYLNWVSVARAYEAVAPVGVEGAADSARTAYAEALALSPKNPAIYLAMARLEASLNELDKAKENLTKAIELKNNYLDAIFLLSQVDAAKGDLRASATSVEKLASAVPNDPSITFQLGILKYQIGDFAGAINALEKSISAVPVYANARYFLGLSYEKMNRVPDAIAQFEEIEKTNPDNQEVALILSNLRAGKASFATSGNQTQVDNKPEKRDQLPIEEKTN